MKGIHGYLHDHVALYRAWHHNPLRAPTHTIVTILAITLAGITLANVARQAPAQAAAGIFAEFPFQGRLTNSDGTVVGNGSYDAVFKLYTVDTGGVPLWTESHTGANKITATDGVFSTMLGSLNSLSGIDFNQDQYWLGITVGADSEMTPRIRLGSAPYAFNSDKLDGVSSEAFLQLPGQAGGQTAYGGTAASQNLVLRSTTNATKGSVLIADDGGNVRVGTAGNASLSVPGTGSSSQTLGVGASASGSLGSIAVGDSSSASTYEALAVGFVSDASGYMSTAIGGRAEATALHAIALGNRSVADEDNSLVIGDNFEGGYETKNIYFGYGRVSSFAPAQTSTLNATGGSGTNISGTALQLAGGRGTGNAIGGSVKISTAPAGSSGSSLNALVTRLTVTDAGNIVPGTGALSTSATDGFVYLGAMAGTPTGTPTSFSGRVPLTYDSTGNTLYAYNSGWQAIGGGGGSISGSGAAGRVTVWNGASSVTSDAEFLYDNTNNTLSIGSTPATNGIIRLPNAQQIVWNDAANGAPDYGLRVTSADEWGFSPKSGYVTLTGDTQSADFQIKDATGGAADLEIEGALKVFDSDNFASTLPASGTIRLPNADQIVWNDAANGLPDYGIRVTSADEWGFSPNVGTGYVTFTGDTQSADFQIKDVTSGTADLQIEGALKVFNANNFASTLPASGTVQLPNAAQIVWNDAANGAPDYGIRVTSADEWGFSPNVSTGYVTLTGDTQSADFQIKDVTSGAASLEIEGGLKIFNQNNFGSALPASGAVRLPNNQQIVWNDAANGAPDYGFRLTNADKWGFSPNGGYVTFTGDTVATNFRFEDTTATNADVEIEGALKVYNQNNFSGAIASSGVIRMPNASSISARNAGNTADVSVVKLNASDKVEVGADLTLNGGDYYDTTIPSAVSSTTLCISGGGQIGTCTSDARLKQNIADLGSGLDVIEQLSPKTYDFVSGQTGQSGFLAQDVQQVLPGLVTKDTGDDYLSLNYNGIVAYAVKAIQELNDRVDNLPVATATHLASLHVTGATTIDGQLAVNGSATFGGDIAVAGDLTVNGAIKGSKQTRGFNVAVPEAASTFTQDGLDLPADGAYSVSILPSWLTNVSITAKGTDSFTVGFSTPAPASATIDYQIQE